MHNYFRYCETKFERIQKKTICKFSSKNLCKLRNLWPKLWLRFRHLATKSKKTRPVPFSIIFHPILSVSHEVLISFLNWTLWTRDLRFKSNAIPIRLSRKFRRFIKRRHSPVGSNPVCCASRSRDRLIAKY